jgi:succinate-semialdehyde dehydrogenase/glutarate-semialdehyde dehydrogenase
MIAKMRNMGQACTAANRFLVHASLADEFAEALAARMGEEVLARGTEPRSTVGP